MVTQLTTYEEIALVDPERLLEMHEGEILEKAGMSTQHGDVMTELAFTIRAQIDPLQYRMRINHARLRRSERGVYIPDVVVVPIAAVRRLLDKPLDLYDPPATLVVEMLSPSTKRIDLMAKLPEYQARGDLEIMILHPIELHARLWTRQADGTYVERTYGPDDEVRLTHLPVSFRLRDLQMP